MTVEATGAYSRDVVYGQLTYPFTPKQTKINAHTPYDKESVSNDTATNSAAMRTAIEGNNITSKLQTQKDFDNIKKLNPSQFLVTKTNEDKDENEEKKEFPPKSLVGTFTASSLSSYDIVSNSLKKGYSAKEAIIISKAHDAYKNSAIGTKNAVKSLSTRSYRIK